MRSGAIHDVFPPNNVRDAIFVLERDGLVKAASFAVDITELGMAVLGEYNMLEEQVREKSMQFRRNYNNHTAIRG